MMNSFAFAQTGLILRPAMM
ncbi:hypothetical protein Goklo_018594, partial [Gossypium klotzschianum]|nr:hypothetical protein [Gossypium klotzschianum]